MTDLVPYETWQIDMDNTKKEIEAYRLLSRGYHILANLPENKESSKATMYHMRANHYDGLVVKCTNFLSKLEDYGKRYEAQVEAAAGEG